MADLRPVDEHSKLGTSPYFNNAAQFTKQLEEMAANGVKSEDELNKLRLSNLTRLGALRKQQEQQVLDAAIKANQRLIRDRMRESFKALKEEEDNATALIEKRLKKQVELENKKRAKKGKAKLTEAEIEAERQNIKN